MAPQIITEEVVSARAGLRPKHSGSIVRKIIIFFFCYGLEMAIERTPLHKTLEPTVYSWFVKKDAKETETNLFVVDISDWIAASSVRLHPDVPSLSFRSGRDYTDRTALIRLLELLNEFGAKAVGFDIDLSMPPLGEAPPPQHNQFLEFASNLLRTNRYITIFLGVARPLLTEPREWLGDPDFTNLVAGIWRETGANLFMPTYFSWPTPEGRVRVDSLALALAATIEPRLKEEDSFLKRWFYESRERTERGPLRYEKVLLNYRLADPQQFTNQWVRGRDFLTTSFREQNNDWLSNSIKNKIVLVGDLLPTQDAGILPLQEEPAPSLLIHRAAIYTLLGHSLYQLGGLANFVIAVLAFCLSQVAGLCVEKTIGEVPVLTPLLRFSFECVLLPLGLAVLLLNWGILPLAILASLAASTIEFVIDKEPMQRFIRIWIRRTTIASILLGLPVFAADPYYIGSIKQINGKAEYRKAPGEAFQKLEAKDRLKELYEDDYLKVPPGSEMVIRFASGNLWTVHGETILKRGLDPGLHTRKEVNFEALALRRAGREMAGEAKEIFQPANKGVIRATNNVVRWASRAAKPTALTLLKVGSEVLSEELATNTQRFVWKDLPKQLEKSKGTKELRIRLEFENGSSAETEFEVLTAANEEKLHRDEVSIAGITDPEDRLLAQAGLARKYQLLNEAAEIFDRLIGIQTNSIPSILIQRAIEINEQIGNQPRVEELKRLSR